MNASEKIIDLHSVAETKPRRADMIAIGVPTHDHVNMHFCQAYVQLATRLALIRRWTFACLNARSSIVANGRNLLVKNAYKVGASKILFLDSDMSFPFDVLERLVAHDKLLVGASYPSRSAPHKNHAKPLGNVRAKVEGLVEVEALPGGCLLVDMAIFDQLAYPWFHHDVDERPEVSGEDYNICAAAKRAGHKVWLDVDLSKELVHWGEVGWRLNGGEMVADDQSDAHLVEMQP